MCVSSESDCVRYNADVTNSFATAAFRFGHSQVTDVMRFANAQFTKRKDVPYSSVRIRK